MSNNQVVQRGTKSLLESVSVTSSMSFLLPFHDRKTVFHYHNMDFLIVFE